MDILTGSTLRNVMLLYTHYNSNKAIIFIEDNNIVRAHNSIRRVKDIVDAFTSSLKVNYAITENLASLYDYFSDRLTEANIRKDSKVLKDLLPLFTELRDAFAEALIPLHGGVAAARLTGWFKKSLANSPPKS